jgi:quercetin dioxygenase-like cupin family protein
MRRFSVLVSIFVLVALSAFGLTSTRIAAQDATPAAGPNLVVGQLAPLGEPFEALPGIDIEFLNEGQAAGAPGQSLVLYRVTLREGEVPPHIHPGATLLTVESGELSWTLEAGTVSVTRPGEAPEEVTEPGTEIVLNPGEGLSYNADVVHTARAAGDEPAVVVIASLFEVGQPFITPIDEHGTPTP